MTIPSIAPARIIVCVASGAASASSVTKPGFCTRTLNEPAGSRSNRYVPVASVSAARGAVRPVPLSVTFARRTGRASFPDPVVTFPDRDENWKAERLEDGKAENVTAADRTPNSSVRMRPPSCVTVYGAKY